MALPHSLRALGSPNFRRYYTGIAFMLQLPSFRRHLRPVHVSRGIIPASEEER